MSVYLKNQIPEGEHGNRRGKIGQLVTSDQYLNRNVLAGAHQEGIIPHCSLKAKNYHISRSLAFYLYFLTMESSIGQNRHFSCIEADLTPAIIFQKHNDLDFLSIGVTVKETIARVCGELLREGVPFNDSIANLTDNLHGVDGSHLTGDCDVIVL
jgi:hypothetical protein